MNKLGYTYIVDGNFEWEDLFYDTSTLTRLINKIRLSAYDEDLCKLSTLFPEDGNVYSIDLVSIYGESSHSSDSTQRDSISLHNVELYGIYMALARLRWLLADNNIWRAFIEKEIEGDEKSLETHLIQFRMSLVIANLDRMRISEKIIAQHNSWAETVRQHTLKLVSLQFEPSHVGESGWTDKLVKEFVEVLEKLSIAAQRLDQKEARAFSPITLGYNP